MAQRKFEYSDAKSYKFWNVEVKGTDVLTTYGRVGTNGQTTVKSFGSVADAEKACEKLIKQKLGKGYNEKSGTAKKAAPAKAASKAPVKKAPAKQAPAKKASKAKAPAATAKAGKSAGGRREFHFVSGSSSKFWAIELKGSSIEITYGKIGTDGRAQTKDFPSADKSQAAHDKLVEEKTTKGYVEVGGGDGGDGSSGGVLKAMMFSTTKNEEDIGDMSTFVGQRVVDYKSDKSIKKGNKHVYRIRVDYDDGGDEFEKRLKGFLDSDAAPEAIGLVIGNWTADSGESSELAITTLVANKDRLPKLVAIFLGEIGQEENEMSWIQQSDVSPLLAAFPKLELLRVRGGTDLDLKNPKHDNLRALALETGGLNRKVVAQLSKAKFPNLEYLELWLGTEEYGGTTRVNDLQPILKGKVFPNLKYLGLRNSEIVDEIAGVIINAPIVEQIETLDLSLGNMSDEGAGALMNLPTGTNLKRLDVHYHYMTKPMVKKLKSLPLVVNAANVQDPDDWGDGEMRFIAVSE